MNFHQNTIKITDKTGKLKENIHALLDEIWNDLLKESGFVGKVYLG